MKTLRQETIDTYNNSAEELAEYFRGIGPRVEDIDFALGQAGNLDNPQVLEIGCGDGRDAKEIVARTDSYRGFDISEAAIALARARGLGGDFKVADAVTYDYPKDESLDVIFAFASLLHLDRSETAIVLQKAHAALHIGGIFYMSLKYRPQYEEEVKDDQFGRRLFYFYNAETIMELAGKDYETAATWREIRGHTEWFELALRKI